jgi:hypothetical protein
VQFFYSYSPAMDNLIDTLGLSDLALGLYKENVKIYYKKSCKVIIEWLFNDLIHQTISFFK